MMKNPDHFPSDKSQKSSKNSQKGAPAPLLFRRLRRHFQGKMSGLNFTNPFQLLLSAVLSAQCTDVRVNQVTPQLFAMYPDPVHLMHAPLAQVEHLIRSINFYRTKARRLIEISRLLVERFHGQVPQRMEDLLSLPGVGRKSANVVLNDAFQIPVGVVVETHVIRVARHLGLTQHTLPSLIERDLMDLFPRRQWTELAHLLISLGQQVCTARRPKCHECPVQDLCPSAFRWVQATPRQPAVPTRMTRWPPSRSPLPRSIVKKS